MKITLPIRNLPGVAAVTAVPEPSTLVLAGIGGALVAVAAKRRRAA